MESNTENNQSSRRKFLQQTSLAGAGLMMVSPFQLFSQSKTTNLKIKGNIKSKGYAGFDEHSELRPWNFERRPVGDNDILIEIKYSGVCHSDIHTIRGHWANKFIRR